EGVLGCPKHFPGHGDTGVDSHYSLPVIDVDPDTFRKREIEAFRSFTDAKTRLFMTAHIVVSQIDPGIPATMSRVILNDILRGELGFMASSSPMISAWRRYPRNSTSRRRRSASSMPAPISSACAPIGPTHRAS
ncbi:MAG TPA: glycoside hydrolase family 3 N-terminal domain-containing protein, partial [Nordella sp.]|nr:glycoside hydrolase family 3 N-terminal domain-containing protein [Nordella sp.]